MPAGFRVRDAANVVRINIEDRLTKIIGYVEQAPMATVGSGGRFVAPPGANGSLVVPEFAQGAPFFFVVPAGQVSAYQFMPPTITITGTTLSWTWPDAAVDAKQRAEKLTGSGTYPSGVIGGVRIYYGVY